MKEIVVKVEVPEETELSEEFLRKRVKEEVSRVVREELFIKLLNKHLDQLTRHAREVSEEELVEMGRWLKREMYKDLKKRGLV